MAASMDNPDGIRVWPGDLIACSLPILNECRDVSQMRTFESSVNLAAMTAALAALLSSKYSRKKRSHSG